MPIDFGDKAQEINDTFLAETLAKQKRKTLSIPFSGSCLSCGEPVHERRFCDSDCREHWEENQRRKRGVQRLIG